MPTVTFSTHCYEKDRDKLYKNLDKIIESHKYAFDEVQIVHQDTFPDIKMASKAKLLYVPEERFERLLIKYGMDMEDPRGKEISHGTHWWWPLHTVNHIEGLDAATSDYIVFSDSDCIMVRNEPYSWVDEGIKQLENNPEVFVVSPSDGNPCMTWIMSQQLFLIRRQDFLDMDFNCWDGKFIEGGFMPECYVMLEGRISMYLLKTKKYRQVLTDNWRYWHDPEHHEPPDEYKHIFEDWK